MTTMLRCAGAAGALALLVSCNGSSVGDSMNGGNGNGGSSASLSASLLPLIQVDASGQILREDPAGTTGDRLTAEIEIFSGDFGTLGIDSGDGFADEAAVLTVTRGGAAVYSRTMAFSEDRRVGGVGDITFEIDVRGSAVPSLQPGDDVGVAVNGVALLGGSLAP